MNIGGYLTNRKNLAIGLILLFIASGSFPITAQNIGKPLLPPSGGNWFYVGGSGPGNYTTIQDAIDNASDGDTVFVFNGTYFGYVIINKAITLLGQEKNTTIIVGYFAYTISIVTDSVLMSGFTIYNNANRGEGVRIDSSYNIITNTIIDIPNDRIRLYGHHNTFLGNIIKNTYLYISGDDNIVINNVFSNTYHNPFIDDMYGIYLVDCWDNIISNNSFFNSGVFISLENICDNLVIDNIVNEKPLLYFSNQSNMIVDDPAGQILLVNCTNITIQNQDIRNTTVGVQIVQSNACRIFSNTFMGNHYGICLNGWNNSLFTNSITDNYYGIDLSGHDNVIYMNTLSTNRNGMYLDDTDNNTLLDNIITGNEKSLLLDYGSDLNNIFNNMVQNNTEAIQISGDNNHIEGNIITHNNDHGILLISSDNNEIKNNIITGNNGNGLLFSNCHHTIITKNTITNQRQDGINYLGDDAWISENEVSTNKKNGINVRGNNANISNNTITNNFNGVSVLNSKSIIITGNTFSENNESGICLNASEYCIISGNRLSKNKQGLCLLTSGNNTMVHNIFQRNTRHALFMNCTNYWDQNYWGRPRILPKIIFGTKVIQNEWVVPLIDFDWHPAVKP